MRFFWTGLFSAAAVLLWQAVLVHAQYRGNWTALYCTGAESPRPPELAPENIYLFEASRGYDGQYYHYVAHDPFFRRGFMRYSDAARMRYRRVLVPLAAFILALGQSRLIDRAYIAVVLIFVFLGAYWLADFFSLYGFAPAWGSLFVLIPGVLVSIDRLTVDVALIALSIAFALYFARSSQIALYATLVTMPLVRETGLLVLAGYVGYLLLNRRWRSGLLFCSTAIPAAAWYLFVGLHTAPIKEERWLSIVPLAPLVQRLMKPIAYPLPAAEAFLVTVLDYVALAGMVLAIGIGYAMVRRLKSGPVEIILMLFALLASFLGEGGWWTAYDFSRWLGPLVVFAALEGIRSRKWLYALPVGLVFPRVAVQWGPHLVALARWLCSGAGGMRSN